MPADPLLDVLDLEGRFYQEGYQQGLRDGAQAGRSEGRCLGLEKGFEKFCDSSRLASKAVVWANRLPRNPDEQSGRRPDQACTLPPLPENPRLDKNIRSLYALVEPDTMSTENTDEAVQDFDDRVKRAQGKARVIERIVGQDVDRARRMAGDSTSI